jgi:hypothetical protein
MRVTSGDTGAVRLVMTVTREQELWAMALWVEKTRGEAGWLHIAQEQDRLLTAGDFDGVELWRSVGERFEQLRNPSGGDAGH